MSSQTLIDVEGAWTLLLQYLNGTSQNILDIDETGSWNIIRGLSDAAEDLIRLYGPLVIKQKNRSLIVANLGQSLDGYISTNNGNSYYVTGKESIIHLHRMRALFDAVIVGANTVDADNPKLTTRLVSGNNPTRVVIDPNRKLSPSHQVFTDESVATVLLCAQNLKQRNYPALKNVEILELPNTDEGISTKDCIDALGSRGLHRLFIEGGGITVSRFFNAGVLDRLHITVAPVMFGAGKVGIQPTAAINPGKAFRGKHCRTFPLGDDILFDFEF